MTFQSDIESQVRERKPPKRKTKPTGPHVVRVDTTGLPIREFVPYKPPKALLEAEDRAHELFAIPSLYP